MNDLMEKIKKGKLFIISIIFSYITLDLIIILLNFSIQGDLKLATIIRFLLTLFIFAYLYEGHKWARVLISIFIMLSAFFISLDIQEVVQSINTNITIYKIIVALLPIFTFVLGFLLLTSRNVTLFQNYQRRKRAMHN